MRVEDREILRRAVRQVEKQHVILRVLSCLLESILL